MDKNRKIAIIYYLCAVAFYISAVIYLVGDASRSIGVVWLAIGSMWLCLGSTYMNKAKKDEDDRSTLIESDDGSTDKYDE